MKTDPKYDNDYIYRVCGSSELEQATHDGWQLVEHFFMTMQDTHEVSREDVFPPEGNFSSPGTRVLYQLGAPISYAQFLIRRKRGEYNQVKDLEQQLVQERVDVAALRAAIQEEKKQLEASKQRYDGLMRDKDYFRKQYEESRDANQCMEKDISKLRQHFGEKAVKEVLGEKVTQ